MRPSSGYHVSRVQRASPDIGERQKSIVDVPHRGSASITAILIIALLSYNLESSARRKRSLLACFFYSDAHNIPRFTSLASLSQWPIPISTVSNSFRVIRNSYQMIKSDSKLNENRRTKMGDLHYARLIRVARFIAGSAQNSSVGSLSFHSRQSWLHVKLNNSVCLRA